MVGNRTSTRKNSYKACAVMRDEKSERESYGLFTTEPHRMLKDHRRLRATTMQENHLP